MTKIKNGDNTKCWQGWKESGSLIACGNIKWYSQSGKKYSSFSKTKPVLYDLAIVFLGFILKKEKLMFTHKFVHKCS